MVLDVRFLPNPHWDEALRPLTGHDPKVSDYVLETSVGSDFVDRIDELLASIRKHGYAVSAPVLGDPAVGLAVPVRVRGGVMACISLRYLGRAFAEKDVAKRYLTLLQSAAAEIARGATQFAE